MPQLKSILVRLAGVLLLSTANLGLSARGILLSAESFTWEVMVAQKRYHDFPSTVTERNDYHPYGARHSNSSPTKANSNRWRFSGKEELGERFYDRAAWSSLDPLAEKYYSISPYAFCAGNPIIFVDRDGKLLGDPVKDPMIRRNRASNLFGEGIRISSTGELRNHQGFDYYAPEGTDILSVRDGIVVDIVNNHADYGKYVTIEHIDANNNKLYSFYAHLSEITVSIGDIVKEGQIIAKSGITGNASNLRGLDQHLHFELRTQANNAKGLSGKRSPNEIVDTKFKSQNELAKRQNELGIIKIRKDGTEEFLQIIF